MKLLWACLVVDSLIVAILFFYFVAGLGDGSVSSFNMDLWLLLVVIPAAVLLGGLRLKAVGRPGAATLLLALVAVPGLVVGGVMLLLIVLFAMQTGAYR